MKSMRVERLGKLFRAAANPKRIRIIKAVMAGSSSINDISMNTALPYKTIERHLEILSSVGLIQKTRSGLMIDYDLNTNDKDIYHKTILQLINQVNY